MKKKATQSEDGGNAKVQEVQNVNDENHALSNDSGNRPQPVPDAASSQSEQEDVCPEQEQAYDGLLQKLNEVADKMLDFIPNADNYMIDLSREPIRRALADAMTPIVIDLLHELLKARHDEMLEARRRERVEVERDGKTIVFENEALAYVFEKYNEVVDWHEGLRNVTDERMDHVRAYNQVNKKVRAHLLSEFRNAVAFMKRFKAECNAEIKGYLDTAIASVKANQKPVPKKPEDNAIFSLLRYWLISVPSYKIPCFLTDRYTLGFFHAAIVSALIILTTTICFMASNEAKLEREAEKYEIARFWSGVEDEIDAKSRFRILDALFEDEKNNRQEINDLAKQLREKYDKQQREKAGK